MSDNLLNVVLKNQEIIFDAILRLKNDMEDRRFNDGIILSKLNANKDSKVLLDYEFKVFSQWGEDGIIQHLINAVCIKNKTFIEFGVEDFGEANCKFLLMKDNWDGLVIDGSDSNISKLKNTNLYWKYQLEAVCAFITRENINDLLAQSGFDEEIGILSIDIDGNDFHVLEAITFVKPSILICEFNAVFGMDRKISVPYRPDFQRTKAHYSNLYFGASLPALVSLAARKGYSLVGVNSAGVNAFFVRNELLNDKVSAVSVAEVFSTSKFRESRSEQGNLTHIAGSARLELLRGMPVLNVENQCIELL